MGKLTPLQLSRVVALGVLEDDVDEAFVEDVLGKYGDITDVQFWTSGNGKRHGFVTFARPQDARSCLEHASDDASSLPVKAVLPNTLHRYQLPESASWVTFNNQSAEGPLPLIKRIKRSEPPTPTFEYDQPMTDSEPLRGGGQQILVNPFIQSPQRRVTRAPTNGALTPPQQRIDQVASTSNISGSSLGDQPTTSQLQVSSRPTVPPGSLQGLRPSLHPVAPSAAPQLFREHSEWSPNKSEGSSGASSRQVQETSSRVEAERMAQAKEIEAPKATIENAHSNLQAVTEAHRLALDTSKEEKARLLRDLEERGKEIERRKADRDVQSRDIERRVQEATRYKAQRDKLYAEVTERDNTIALYQTESKKLIADLARETEIRQKQETTMQVNHTAELARIAELRQTRETDLQDRLICATDEVSRLKKELADQAQLLVQRTLELEKSLQKMTPQTLEIPPRQSRFSNPRKDTHPKRDWSEPEEGQLRPNQPTGGVGASNGPFRSPHPSLSHQKAVISALEKAFTCLDEIIAAALRDGERTHDQEGPSKRQKRVGDA